jgi:flagellar motility protein MotE (MotC chaperone)
MVRIISYLILIGVLFGAGLGLALFLGVPAPPAEPLADPNLVSADLADILPTNPDSSIQLEPTTPIDQLPVPIRGEALTAEELFRFGTMYREQQEALTNRQTEIERKESRLKLMHDDLLGSRKEFDGLRAQAADTALRAKQMLQQLQSEREQYELRKNDDLLEQKVTRDESAEPNEDEAGNLRKISAWFQVMPPEKAAEHLRQLSNEGKMDSAVKLLGNIEERNAAKILAAMEDSSLVVELTEAFRNTKHQEIRTARRR